MNTYICSGRGPGMLEHCDFTTTDEQDAARHFEEFDHDLELIETEIAD